MTLHPTFVYAATVVHVVDGDTIDVDLDLGMRITVHSRLRLEHIDAPEVSTAEGKAARDYLRGWLLPGMAVTVATAKPDKFGRALATVVLSNGTDIARRMLDTGHAVPYEGGARVANPAK